MPPGDGMPAKDPRLAPWALGAAGSALLVAGLAGGLDAAWGYGLFAASVLLLGAGGAVFAVFALSRAGDTRTLAQGASALLWSGLGAYVLALCALAGYFAYETFQGRMEWHWIAFGPAILAALVVLDLGLYRKLVKNNLPTWQRFRPYISRERSDPAALRRTLVDDVILQRSLYRTSKLRWLRHALIFWGFAAMFLVELAAVFLREGFPAFGWPDIWRVPGHPVRLAFDFVFDFTGLMILSGCLLALAFRASVNARPERKFTDTPTTLFLLFVVASGFVVEGLRIAPAAGDPAHAASFVGVAFARALNAAGWANPAAYDTLWLVHVIGACAFIAYVPVQRLVHSCATPMGRLMGSQKELLEAKRRGVLGAMLRGAPAAARPGVPGAIEANRP